MRLFNNILVPLLSLTAGLAAADFWTFEDATLSVSGKGAGIGGGLKEKLSNTAPLTSEVSLGPSDTLKIILTTAELKTPKRAHQAFLTIREPVTGLEESFPFVVKESGKGRVEVTQKDLPIQFLAASGPLSASLIIASFGSSTPYNNKVFSLTVARDSNVPLAIPAAPPRYGKLAEINHIFHDGPHSPPSVISFFFTLVVIGALPVLVATWLLLGANVSHLGKAMGSSPVSHVLFFGSIVALEGVFFLYYTSWNLFQMLPAAGVLGAVAFVSGSRALSEVQERRLAGLR